MVCLGKGDAPHGVARAAILAYLSACRKPAHVWHSSINYSISIEGTYEGRLVRVIPGRKGVTPPYLGAYPPVAVVSQDTPATIGVVMHQPILPFHPAHYNCFLCPAGGAPCHG